MNDGEVAHELLIPVDMRSASAQGNALASLVRVYQQTGDATVLQAARQVVHTLERDILDGGVSTLLGLDGLFFEEEAVYPATHELRGHMLALLGLYAYVAGTGDQQTECLLARGLSGLDSVLVAFDTGYWTRVDLLHGRLASRSLHEQHGMLLQELARLVRCEQCAVFALRWQGYQHRLSARLHYELARHIFSVYDHVLRPRLQRLIAPALHRDEQSQLHVCVPITAFPVPGGMRGVLAGVAQVMDNYWHMTYLAQRTGRRKDALQVDVEVFGGQLASPWHFPTLWLYSVSGGMKLLTLLRRSTGYHLLLPQDGVFSGAFAAVIGKLAGVHVVCMDHGNMTWLENTALYTERVDAYIGIRRLLARLQFAAYRSSLRVLAQITKCCSDQFLVAGDEVEEVCRHTLGVSAWRIVRYAYIVDSARFVPVSAEQKNSLRAKHGFASDAIIVTMINRLAPEKGLSVAVEGLASALAALPAAIRSRVNMVIAGEGPLRSQVEADIQRHGLEMTCVLWGNASPSDVVLLLQLSDIFLYSGTRGTNYSVAVLEAMAAGCAVIASRTPRSNALLLADERGIAIAPGNARELALALTRLCSDAPLRAAMGQAARDYITTHHTPAALQRVLLRVSPFRASPETPLPSDQT